MVAYHLTHAGNWEPHLRVLTAEPHNPLHTLPAICVQVPCFKINHCASLVYRWAGLRWPRRTAWRVARQHAQVPCLYHRAYLVEHLALPLQLSVSNVDFVYGTTPLDLCFTLRLVLFPCCVPCCWWCARMVDACSTAPVSGSVHAWVHVFWVITLMHLSTNADMPTQGAAAYEQCMPSFIPFFITFSMTCSAWNVVTMCGTHTVTFTVHCPMHTVQNQQHIAGLHSHACCAAATTLHHTHIRPSATELAND